MYYSFVYFVSRSLGLTRIYTEIAEKKLRELKDTSPLQKSEVNEMYITVMIQYIYTYYMGMSFIIKVTRNKNVSSVIIKYILLVKNRSKEIYDTSETHIINR